MDNGQKDILKRTFNLAVNTIGLIRTMRGDTVIQILFKQLIRSSTSIGANLEEAQDAHSKKEFIQKTSIALKESRETNYWIRLLKKIELLDNIKFNHLETESLEILKILTAIVKKSKQNVKK
jgi:four helix bundle protein